MRHFLGITLVLVLCAPLTAKAGWYQVANYKGQVAGDTVLLSLQRYDSFGSGITVEGTYIGKDHTPVPLYGRRAGDSLTHLCEVRDRKDYERYLVQGVKGDVSVEHCPIALAIEGSEANGTWRIGGRTQKVKFERAAEYDDQTTSHGALEVPFWGQTPDHAAFGRYDDDRPVTIGIVEKSDGKVIQQIDPATDGCTFGHVMTPIYMNVEFARDKSAVRVNCGGGSASDFLVYDWDVQQKRFVVRKAEPPSTGTN